MFVLGSLSTAYTAYQLTCQNSWHISADQIWGESEDAQHAMWYLIGQRFWNFWTNTTIICLAFFKEDRCFSFDRSADRNEDFVAVGNFINSQGRRFSEFERSNLDNFKLEWPDPKHQVWLPFSAKYGEHLQNHVQERAIAGLK